MENNLNEELLRQIGLMDFNVTKTLLEQKVIPSDRLGSGGNFRPLDPIKANYDNLNSIKLIDYFENETQPQSFAGGRKTH